MFSAEEITKILFIDIETVRCVQNFEQLSEGMSAMWQHKAESIKNEESVEEKFYERAAIYAEFGRVVCISFGFIYWQDKTPKMKIKSFFGKDEKLILEQFKTLVDDKFKDWQLCAHNGKEFDFPYLCRRYLINGLHLPKILQIQGKKPWEIPHLDTMELWKFGDYKAYTKLELLCQVFAIPSPKDEMDGSLVGKVFWEEGDAVKIARYCEKDVIATAQLMLKYAVLPDLTEENIINSDR